MDNPVLVEVTRGQWVESVHRGAIAIVDATGRCLVSLGDIARPVFPRSAIKPLQALYLVESGAVEAFGLTDQDIALACASHNGEKAHVSGVNTMLDRAGLGADALECGTQWPKRPSDRNRMARAGEEASQLHNNCSGKHAGFLSAAHYLGEKTQGYIASSHPTQQALKGLLETLSDWTINDPAFVATDGCSIPTYAVPLENMARAMARMAAANGLGPLRDQAARAIFEACVAHPHLVAGKMRFDTIIMEAFKGDVLVKTGAEGVYAGIIPSLGLGIALKCDDGGTRAAEVMMATCLKALMPDHVDALEAALHVDLNNRNGWPVGEIRPVDGVIDRLKLS